VGVLLAAGADLHTQRRGRAALHVAASASIVYALVRAGADVDSRNAYGGTPLHAAVVEAPGVILALLACGADLAAADGTGKTALACALEEVEVEVATSGHYPASVVEDDDTPSHPAYLKQLAAICRVLAMVKALVAAPTRSGWALAVVSVSCCCGVCGKASSHHDSPPN